MKFLERIKTVIFPDTQEITEEIIRHYEKNPDELDLVVNREHFNAFFLGIVFVLGLGIAVIARVLRFFYADVVGEFTDTIFLDLLSEMGNAIFGGAVVAYLIESLNKRQFQENIKFRREIKRIINERKIERNS